MLYVVLKNQDLLKKKKQKDYPVVSKTSNGGTMILSNCAICGIKKSRFIEKKEAKGLLNNLGLKTSLSKIPILGDVLF